MLEKERDKSEISLQDPKISEHTLFFTGVHPQSAKLDFTFDATDQFEHGGLQKFKIQREPRDFTRVHPQSSSDDFTFDSLDYLEQRGKREKQTSL